MDIQNLYESLRYNIPDEDLTDGEKEELLDLIKNFNEENKQHVYLLILHNYTKSNPKTKTIFPYKLKQYDNNRLEIKLDALPINLKRILYKFAKLVNSNNI